MQDLVDLAAVMLVLAVVGLAAIRFGADSRPGFDERLRYDDERWNLPPVG